MTDITIKAHPDVLLSKSGELSSEKNTLLSLMDEAKSQVNSLAGVWKGDAADGYQNRFKQIYDDIDNMLAIVTEYISDLNEIANIYSTAEKAALNESEGLPTDGVFRV